MADKSLFILQRYRMYYKRVLKLPYWSKSEINALGPTLRPKIEADAKLKQMVKAKIENLKLTAAGFPPVIIHHDIQELQD